MNTYTTNRQDSSAVAALTNGNFVVTWHGNGQDDIFGIYSQIFSPLTVNNISQTDTYTEDTLKALNDIVIVAAANDQATATLTLAPSTAGSLSTGTSGSVTSTYNAETGVWQASGNITDVNALLGNLQFSPAANYNANVTISISITDNGGATETGSIALTGIAINDAPVITTSSGNLSYTEGAAATAIDAALTVSDIDNANLTGATIQISDNYQNGEDVLAFTKQNGITGTFDTATGLLTLSGTATVAQYQTALRQVTYQNTSQNPSTAARMISFSVSDGTLTSAVATKHIAVIAINNAPILLHPIGDKAVTVAEPFSFYLARDTFFDAENDTLTLSAEQVDGQALPTNINFYPDEAKFNGSVSTASTTNIRVWARDPAAAAVNADFKLVATAPAPAPVVTDTELTTPAPNNTAALVGSLVGGAVGLGALLTGLGIFLRRRLAKPPVTTYVEMQSEAKQPNEEEQPRPTN